MTSKAKKKSGKSRPARFAGRTSSVKKAAKARPPSARRSAGPSAVTPAVAAEPLDQFIPAAANLLELPLKRAWLPAIKANLEVTLRFGASIAAFELSDDTEPAPVFGA